MGESEKTKSDPVRGQTLNLKKHPTQLKMKNILFLGCGKMGSIIANNLVNEKSFKASQISVIKKSDKNKIEKIKYFKKFDDLKKNYQADLVFLCIKPQDSEKILQELVSSNITNDNTIFISILAGKKIAFFEKIFGQKSKIIRSMPNLPIEDSQGIFSYMANKNLAKNELEKLEEIFNKFGAAFKIEDEKLFDIATAIFGSGPAYIFYLQELISKIAGKNKIKKSQADELIKTLFLGSSLMSCNSPLDFKKLKTSVTSKGGTTAAALEVFEKNNALENLLEKAINNASKRSKDLSA